MVNEAKVKSENEEILKTLIKSYEILEEKLENVNGNIDNLKSEINGGLYQEEKREKVKNFLPGQVKNSIFPNE